MWIVLLYKYNLKCEIIFGCVCIGKITLSCFGLDAMFHSSIQLYLRLRQAFCCYVIKQFNQILLLHIKKIINISSICWLPLQFLPVCRPFDANPLGPLANLYYSYVAILPEEDTIRHRVAQFYVLENNSFLANLLHHEVFALNL